MVWEVARALPQLGIIGIGGIASASDALEFMVAGASAIQVGTATFYNPPAAENLLDELTRLLEETGVAAAREIIGTPTAHTIDGAKGGEDGTPWKTAISAINAAIHERGLARLARGPRPNRPGPSRDRVQTLRQPTSFDHLALRCASSWSQLIHLNADLAADLRPSPVRSGADGSAFSVLGSSRITVRAGTSRE
jgi:hypothetical protein